MDRSTGEALPYAGVYLEGAGKGTTTNRSGEFVLRITSGADSIVLSISHLGFKTYKAALSRVRDQYLRISLEPELLQLQEVVVRPPDPLEIINSALDRIPLNYYLKPYRAEGFQREYVTSGERFLQLMEVAFRTKRTSGSQSSQVLSARYIEDKEEKEPLWDPARGGFYTFGWTEVSGIAHPSQKNFLGVELKRKTDLGRYYEFEWKGSVGLENSEVHIIAFDQRKGVKEALMKGTLYVDAESYAIVKLSYQLSPRGVKFLRPHKTRGGIRVSKPPKKIRIQQDQGEITFKRFGKKWFMHSLIMNAQFDAALVFLGATLAEKNDLRFHSERVVTSIDTTGTMGGSPTNISEVGSLPTLQNFIKREFENYDADETWSEFNIIKSDTSFAQIAEQLRLNNDKWEQQQKKLAAQQALSMAYDRKQIIQDLDYLQESLENLHPGLHWYTGKDYYEEQLGLIKKGLKKKTTEGELFQLLGPLIESINCGHTGIYPSKDTEKYHEFHPHQFPLNLWFSSNSAFVINNYKGIPRGSELISINDHTVSDIAGHLRSVIPSDGYNSTYKEFHLQKDFSHLYSWYYPATDTFTVSFRDRDHQTHTTKVPGRVRKVDESARHASFMTIDSMGVGLLKIPSLATDQDFPSFLEATFQKLEKADLEFLIIDLRDNEGGRDDHSSLLYSYLANGSYRFYDQIMVATADTTWLNRLSFGNLQFGEALPGYVPSLVQENDQYHYKDHQNLKLHYPQPHPFAGTVYILINGGTFSAAAEFAAMARSTGRATFIGQETGGGYYGNCSLGTPLLTLPNSKLRVAIPLGRYEMAVREDVPPGHGVIPDHETVYHLEDVLAGRDKELELCFRLMRSVKDR